MRRTFLIAYVNIMKLKKELQITITTHWCKWRYGFNERIRSMNVFCRLYVRDVCCCNIEYPCSSGEWSGECDASYETCVTRTHPMPTMYVGGRMKLLYSTVCSSWWGELLVGFVKQGQLEWGGEVGSYDMDFCSGWKMEMYRMHTIFWLSWSLILFYTSLNVGFTIKFS